MQFFSEESEFCTYFVEARYYRIRLQSLTNRTGRFVVPGSIPINATTRNHYTCRRNDKQPQNKGIRTN